MKTPSLRKFFQTTYRRFHESGVFLYWYLVAPRSTDEDDRRREFIVTIVLLTTLTLLTLAEISIFFDTIRYGALYHGVRLSAFSILVLFFFCLYLLSRKGYFRFVSYILLLLYFLGTAYSMHRWGVALPVVLVSCAAIIVMASILISTRFGFIATGIVIATLFMIGYAQTHGSLKPELYWQSRPFRLLDDGIIYSTILLLIGVISWLSNRETESSLARARASEAALVTERDLLEIKVEQRTEELKKLQLDEISRMYRFIEFGRLATGIVHDLMNPLTAICINISNLDVRKADTVEAAKVSLDRAVSASQRMTALMEAVRSQMGERELCATFSLHEQLLSVMELFRYKAHQKGVVMHYETPEVDYCLSGNSLKFHQVAANLLSNAIDACSVEAGTQPSSVYLAVASSNEEVIFTVRDTGSGILQEHIEKIFEPFFTTKPMHEGTGIGLSTAKHIVEKSFGGSIGVSNAPEGGALFVVRFPHQSPL